MGRLPSGLAGLQGITKGLRTHRGQCAVCRGMGLESMAKGLNQNFLWSQMTENLIYREQEESSPTEGTDRECLRALGVSSPTAKSKQPSAPCTQCWERSRTKVWTAFSSNWEAENCANVVDFFFRILSGSLESQIKDQLERWFLSKAPLNQTVSALGPGFATFQPVTLKS